MRPMRRRARARCRRILLSAGAIASAIGNRITVAAAFDITIDRKNEVNAIATRNDRRPPARRATASPIRTGKPCTCIASATKNEPTNRNKQRRAERLEREVEATEPVAEHRADRGHERDRGGRQRLGQPPRDAQRHQRDERGRHAVSREPVDAECDDRPADEAPSLLCALEPFTRDGRPPEGDPRAAVSPILAWLQPQSIDVALGPRAAPLEFGLDATGHLPRRAGRRRHRRRVEADERGDLLLGLFLDVLVALGVVRARSRFVTTRSAPIIVRIMTFDSNLRIVVMTLVHFMSSSFTSRPRPPMIEIAAVISRIK